MKIIAILLMIIYPLIANSTLHFPNSIYKVESENGLYALISIPQNLYGGNQGETIIINNQTKEQIWNIKEYIKPGTKFILSNNGEYFYTLNIYSYVNQKSESPTIFRFFSINGIYKTYDYEQLFGYKLEKDIGISTPILGYYINDRAITLLSEKNEKTSIDLSNFSLSNKKRVRKNDLKKIQKIDQNNIFKELKTQELKLENPNTIFFDEILKEISKYYDVKELSDKESLEVAFYLTINLKNGKAEVLNCEIIYKKSQGYEFDKSVSNDISKFIESLSFKKINPYNSDTWMYTINYYLK